MRLIDISPALGAATPVFPGDASFSLERTWQMSPGCPVNVSRFSMSTHAGAHADAPLHYAKDGAPIDAAPLERYIGPCTVLHRTPFDAPAPLDASALRALIGGRKIQQRLLIRFYSRAPQDRWDENFPAIAADATHFAADAGVVLIGVDTQSLDPATSKTMDAHGALAARGLSVLENLVLDAVDEGDYELIAPPLKIAGGDAAPVRAVLRTLR